MNKILMTVVIMNCMLTGCMSSTIEGSGTPQDTNGEEVIHGSYYGFVWRSYDIKKSRNNLGLYRVVNHTNYLYSAVAFLSLGLYVPQQVEWWVQKPLNQDYTGQKMQSSRNK